MLKHERTGEWMSCRVPRELLQDADKVRALLANRFGLPFAFIDKLRNQGGLRFSGDRLRLCLFPREAAGFAPEWRELDILYEDDFCLVVNKPPGCKTHPTEPGEGGTMANYIAAYFEMTTQDSAVRHIHRLDADTSGPILYAKCPLSRWKLDACMREKQIRRTYQAIVDGHPNPPAGRVDAPIGRDRHHALRRRVSQGGRPAATRYETLEAFADAARVQLQLETGRTHQIRVHMAYLGCPVHGDRLYGKGDPAFGRQALHGTALRFPHPWTGEDMDIHAGYPDDFQQLLDHMRENA